MFTETLVSHLRERFDIEVAALDQFLLRSTAPSLEKAGDNLIRAIARQASDFDVVNLHWEPGLLGITRRQMLRRLRSIIMAHPNMVVTAHSVVPETPYSPMRIANDIYRRRFRQAVIGATGIEYRFGRATYSILRRAAKRPGFRLIVHTKRERRYFREAIGIRNVYDHPLSGIRKGWEAALPQAGQAIRERFMGQLGPDKKFIGFFGFLAPHKGIQTANLGASIPSGGVYPFDIRGHPSRDAENGRVDRSVSCTAH